MSFGNRNICLSPVTAPIHFSRTIADHRCWRSCTDISTRPAVLTPSFIHLIRIPQELISQPRPDGNVREVSQPVQKNQPLQRQLFQLRLAQKTATVGRGRSSVRKRHDAQLDPVRSHRLDVGDSANCRVSSRWVAAPGMIGNNHHINPRPKMYEFKKSHLEYNPRSIFPVFSTVASRLLPHNPPFSLEKNRGRFPVK